MKKRSKKKMKQNKKQIETTLSRKNRKRARSTWREKNTWRRTRTRPKSYNRPNTWQPYVPPPSHSSLLFLWLARKFRYNMEGNDMGNNITINNNFRDIYIIFFQCSESVLHLKELESTAGKCRELELCERAIGRCEVVDIDVVLT